MTTEELITQHEGWRNTAYQDVLGIWTIGVGHNLQYPISDAAVRQIFKDDLRAMMIGVFGRFPWMLDLDEVRQAAFLDAAFNLGVGGLAKFYKTLAAAHVADWETAARELLDSQAARELPRRYKTLAEMLRTGQWPQEV